MGGRAARIWNRLVGHLRRTRRGEGKGGRSGRGKPPPRQTLLATAGALASAEFTAGGGRECVDALAGALAFAVRRLSMSRREVRRTMKRAARFYSSTPPRKDDPPECVAHPADPAPPAFTGPKPPGVN